MKQGIKYMENKFEQKLDKVLGELKQVLISKNKKYGNSALEPKRIFSKADPVEQIKVRIDDKLSRMITGTNDNEDTVLDLMGYLVLLKIAENDIDGEEYIGYATQLTTLSEDAKAIEDTLNVEHAKYRYVGIRDNIHIIENIYTHTEFGFPDYDAFKTWLRVGNEDFPNLTDHEDGDK